MNEIMRDIKRKIVDPEFQRLKLSVRGFVGAVYYEERVCDVIYFDTDGAQKKIKRIKMPESDGGVFSQTLQAGDKVELTYRNKSDVNLYISKVYRREASREDFKVENGQLMPLSTHLF